MTRHAPSRRRRRGTVAITVVVLMLLLELFVVGMVVTGGHDHDLTAQRMDTIQSMYAAEAGTNMAMREIYEDADEDGDGTVGSISDDANAANDPVVGGATVSVAKAINGTTLRLTSTASRGLADRRIQSRLLDNGASTGGTRLLLVVPNAASLSASDTNHKDLFESWGYTVTVIDQDDDQDTFDAALELVDVAYISEQVTSGSVGSKLTATTVGVVNEESYLNDDLLLTNSNGGTFSDDEIDIVDATHYITSDFSTGDLAILTGSYGLRRHDGTLGAGVVVLAEQPSSSNRALIVIDVDGTLYGGTPAPGRRVSMAVGNDASAFNNLSTSGKMLVKRCIQWAAGGN